MPRGNRTEEQMKDFAEEHLNYEVQMLFAMENELSDSSLPQHLKNAYLESFTIHSRALIDFFWKPNRTKKDDALANDYFPEEGEWQNICPEFPKVLEPARYRTGKEIAHLTYTRMDVEEESKSWLISVMVQEIDRVVTIFSNNAHPNYIGRALEEFKSEKG